MVPLTAASGCPAAVVAFANRLLPALGVDVPAGRCRCAATARCDVRAVADLAAATVAEVRAALGARRLGRRDRRRRRGRRAARGARRRRASPTATADDVEAAARVTVVPATLAKGLEYDHVVVVEPAAIVAAEPRGLHRLYVVLTRAVSRLTVLHTAPLPAPLR